MTDSDGFEQVYDRDNAGYGSTPSADLYSYLQQVGPSGEAIDLGAGAGRDTLALAEAGLNVCAVDLSPRGLQRIVERAGRLPASDRRGRIRTLVSDVRQVPLPDDFFAVVSATTILCHLPPDDAWQLWNRMAASRASDGMLYVEVHTTEDPGSPLPPGNASRYPASETAWAVQHYFAAGELLEWAVRTPALRVLRYEERLEWDQTHGHPHLHGKAVLTAVRQGYHPPWFGHPAAFPMSEDTATNRITNTSQ